MRIAALVAALVVGAGSTPAFGFDDYTNSPEPGTITLHLVGAPKSTPAIEAPAPHPQTAALAAEIIEIAVPEPLLPVPSPAPVERALPPTPVVVARIDLTSQSMHVSVSGMPRHIWAISSGREGYATPRGTFQPQWSARMWYSRKYDYAPMPHAVFFNGGVAVHATSATKLLGRPASHGCIRLAPEHAAQFYRLVQQHGAARVSIQVIGVAPVGIASRQGRSKSANAAGLGGPSRLVIRRYDGSGNAYWAGPSRVR